MVNRWRHHSRNSFIFIFYHWTGIFIISVPLLFYFEIKLHEIIAPNWLILKFKIFRELHIFLNVVPLGVCIPHIFLGVWVKDGTVIERVSKSTLTSWFSSDRVLNGMIRKQTNSRTIIYLDLFPSWRSISTLKLLRMAHRIKLLNCYLYTMPYCVLQRKSMCPMWSSG